MKQCLVVLLTLGLLCTVTLAQDPSSPDFKWEKFNMKKAPREIQDEVLRILEANSRKSPAGLTGSASEIRSLIINGNKITTVVYNYGSITRPNTLGNVADLVWNRLGYGYEFAPLVTCAIPREQGDTLKIVDDGLWVRGQGDYSPAGEKWGWLPVPGYAAPGQSDIAAWSHRADVGGDLTRRPHSWPESFYNPAAGRYVWPAYLGNDASTPDEEVYFVMDDFTNAEYPYYPFAPDSSKRGLGLEMECRFFQFNNPLAEDIIFLVYRTTNKSPRQLQRVFFGMYGDPHVGGPADYNDDLFGFVGPKDSTVSQKARNIVYAWDDDGKGDGGLVSGYFGFKFLESPTLSNDVKDNDDDGIIDESPFNDAGLYIDGTAFPLTTGIADTVKYKKLYGAPKPRWSGDENGDWNPERDDSGLDGIPETGDFGEGNGRPDIGTDARGNITAEPNFGIRDVNESDQIGLTSFTAMPFETTNYPSNDELFYEKLSTEAITIDPRLLATPGDNVFLYGSGPFDLHPNDTQRFSIALLMGTNLSDLLLNSETAQRVLEANYRFAQPPPKPLVSVVPGDGRVTLFWDNAAEPALDPLTNTRDFEGYKVYRSQDPSFSDVYTITDANGASFLPRAFEQNGVPAQFDLKNTWSGLHPVEYLGRGVKYWLGNNTGLVHEYVDSSVTNGVTYYYAVASYDHGLDSLSTQLPPSESQIAILIDPVTKKATFDVNTAAVTPGPLASGYKPAGLQDGTTVRRLAGLSTGTIIPKVMDDLAVREGAEYRINFSGLPGKVVYDVVPETPFTETFVSRDTIPVPLSKKNIQGATTVVKDQNGATVAPTRYAIDEPAGRIRGVTPGSLPAGATFQIQYKYEVIAASNRLNNEDDNPVFDGIRLFLQDVLLTVDSVNSGWVVKGNTNVGAVTRRSQAFPTLPYRPAPIDVQVRWNKTDTLANGKWAFPGDTLFNQNNRRVVVCPFKVVNVIDTSSLKILVNRALTDSMWRPGREINILTPPKYAGGASNAIMMEINFTAPLGTPLVLPTEGDIYEGKSSKPFAEGDQYAFTTKSSRYEPATAQSMLDRIYVVPNPYVAYSNLEEPGNTPTARGEHELQFRNLPPQCTIRIYTLTGELVDTIEKNDTRSHVPWAILSNEGQRLAYGVYIYHVDVPGVGEKIGRLALIK